MPSKAPQQMRKPPTGKLTKVPASAANVAAVKQFFGLISLDIDVDRARQLQLRNKAITALPPQLGTILGQVQKLDLSQNDIRDLSPLGTLPHLTNLTITGNASLKSLESLSCTRLVVLAASGCGLTSLRGLSVCGTTLRALIANDNDIRLQSPVAVTQAEQLAPYVQPTAHSPEAVENYEVLAALTACDTIVLSRNPRLCELFQAPLFGEGATRTKETTEGTANDVAASSPDTEVSAPADPALRQLIASAHPLSVFEKLQSLKKLSLSDCGLSSLPLRWFLPVVTELRLAKNALRSFQPDGVICRSLKILDVSHNRLDALGTLRRCRYLKQLNLRGNPLVAHYQERDQSEGFRAAASAGADLHTVPITLMRSLPHLFTQLEQVDGQPMLDAEALAQRQKRARDEVAADEAADKASPEPVEEAAKTVVATRPQALTPATPRETKAERAARVAMEEESKDVVTEAPESVAKMSRVPVVRRERTITSAGAAKVKVAGRDAIAKLTAQRNQTNSW